MKLYDNSLYTALLFLIYILDVKCNVQDGPDPWDIKRGYISKSDNENIPLDIRQVPNKKEPIIQSNNCVGDWFFKRLLAIFIQRHKIKHNGEENVEITVHMEFSNQQFEVLNDFFNSADPITEAMYRKSIGIIEEAIKRPNVLQTVFFTWSEYVMHYLEQYKFYVTWLIGSLGVSYTFFIAWMKSSRKQILIMIFLLLYCYEAFASYKEAEKQEYDNLISTLNSCRWMFWTSTCHLPATDPLVFIRHLHPLKIGMRLISVFFTEPIISISTAVQAVIGEVCDKLPYPLNLFINIILSVITIIAVIMAVLMIVCNLLLNIPMNMNFAGLFTFGVSQRRRNVTLFDDVPRTSHELHQDRLSGPNLDKLLSLFAKSAQSSNIHHYTATTSISSISNDKRSIDFTRGKGKIMKNKGLRKSASTGRLNVSQYNTLSPLAFRDNFEKTKFEIGSGDFTS